MFYWRETRREELRGCLGGIVRLEWSTSDGCHTPSRCLCCVFIVYLNGWMFMIYIYAQPELGNFAIISRRL